MKTFKDLEHTVFRARSFFPNGYGVSVIGGGEGMRGDGKTTFEVCLIKGTKEESEICLGSPIMPYGVGHKTKQQVSRIMKDVQNLPDITL